MGFLQASSRASILLFRGTVDEELDRLDHIVPKIPLAYRLPNESIDLPYTVEAVIAAREESTQRNLVQTARELRPLIARQVIEPSTALRRLVRDAYGSAERLRSAADVLRPDPGEAQAVALLEQAAQLAENPPPPSDAGPAVAP